MGMETPAAFAVGCTVKLRLANRKVLDGEVFAVDERLQTVVLKRGVPRSMNHTLSVINMAAVEDVLEAQPCSPSVKTEDLPVVDLDRSRGRESRAVAQARQDALKIGEGVSREAQAVFDAICKTLPCRWDKTSIVVLDEVVVHAPYTAKDCIKLHETDSPLLHRVQLIVRQGWYRFYYEENHLVWAMINAEAGEK